MNPSPFVGPELVRMGIGPVREQISNVPELPTGFSIRMKPSGCQTIYIPGTEHVKRLGCEMRRYYSKIHGSKVSR